MSDFLAEPTTITDDRLCVGCGYNLRGLSTAAACPECNTPVARSPQEDLLKYADPAWLQKLHLGTTLSLWAVLATLVASIIGGIVSAITPAAAVASIVFALPTILDLIGLLLLTTQEPKVSLEEPATSLRQIIRLFAILTFLGGMVLTVAELAVLPIFSVLSVIATGFADVTCFVCLLVYLRRFALRIPKASLARSTQIVMWGGLSGIAVFLLAVIANLIMAGAPAMRAFLATPPGGPAGPAPTAAAVLSFGAIALFGCAGLVVLSVFAIWSIVFFFQYRAEFQAAINEARVYDALAGLPDEPPLAKKV